MEQWLLGIKILAVFGAGYGLVYALSFLFAKLSSKSRERIISFITAVAGLILIAIFIFAVPILLAEFYYLFQGR